MKPSGHPQNDTLQREGDTLQRNLTVVFIFGRIVLLVWVVFTGAVAVKGWRERTSGEVPEIPIPELAQHQGQRVRVRGLMLGPWFSLPNGHLVALQAVRVTKSRSNLGYSAVWPEEVWVGDGPARVRVETQGLVTQYVRQVARGYTTDTGVGGGAAGWLLPQLNRGIPLASVSVHVLWRSEAVNVVGMAAEESGQPVIRSAGLAAPLIVTAMPPAVLSQASRFEGSWKFALGLAGLLLGLAVWLWLRAGFRQTIAGVKVYPVVAPVVAVAARERWTRSEIDRRTDERLGAVGVDPREYRRQRRANNRRALAAVSACPLLAVLLGVWLGGTPVSVLQAAAESAPDIRRPASPAGTRRMLTFTSDSARVPPGARRVFTRFTLQRPSHWLVAQPPGDPASTFYCSFARRNDQGVIVEWIEVKGYDSEAVTDVNRQSLPLLASQLERQRAESFFAAPTDRKLYERPAEFGGMPAYQAAFQHVVQSEIGGTYTAFWKLVLIPAANGPHRGLVVSFGGNTQAGIASVGDLGTKGELPLIIESLRVLR